MLANDVGRRPHLKIVDEVIVRHEVRMPVLDDVAGVSAEEEWLRRASGATGSVLKRRLHVVPQRQHALLWEVPASFVKSDVELNRGRLITTEDLLLSDGIDVDGIAAVVDSGIGKGSAELWAKGKTIHDK